MTAVADAAPTEELDLETSHGSVADRSRRWRRVVEVLAVGPGSLLLFPIAWALRGVLGLDAAELAVGFVFFQLAHVLNDPHFAVTYLLFYRDVRRRAFDTAIPFAQRARYLAAGFVAPVALVTWAAGALAFRSPQTLGWMAQLMLLLVGWHYAKQGFGVLMVLCARRGVRWTALERTTLLAHAYAAWAFSWAQPARPGGLFEERGVVYWSPARPPWFELASGGALALSTVVLLVVVARMFRAPTARAAIMPLVAYVVTLWLWMIFASADPLVRYAIPAFHAIQYGYFVWLLRSNQARAEQGPPTFGPPVATRVFMLAATAAALGWLLFRGAPGALDAWLVPSMNTTSEDLGATPFVAAFYVVVNLHHFVMDAVIWRREHSETRWLYEGE